MPAKFVSDSNRLFRQEAVTGSLGETTSKNQGKCN